MVTRAPLRTLGGRDDALASAAAFAADDAAAAAAAALAALPIVSCSLRKTISGFSAAVRRRGGRWRCGEGGFNTEDRRDTAMIYHAGKTDGALGYKQDAAAAATAALAALPMDPASCSPRHIRKNETAEIPRRGGTGARRRWDQHGSCPTQVAECSPRQTHLSTCQYTSTSAVLSEGSYHIILDITLLIVRARQRTQGHVLPQR